MEIYEKFRWILAPMVFIIIGLIMKFSNNEKQFGIFLKYRKYWLVLLIIGVSLFLVRLYLFLKSS